VAHLTTRATVVTTSKSPALWWLHYMYLSNPGDICYGLVYIYISARIRLPGTGDPPLWSSVPATVCVPGIPAGGSFVPGTAGAHVLLTSS